MFKYIKFVWRLFAVTLVLHLIRPVEAFIVGLYKGVKAFRAGFIEVYNKEGWTSLDLYSQAVRLFKEGK